MPFVRLALVRYQPNAIDGAKVSQIVQTHFAQLLPRRRAVFSRNGAKLDISLHGYVPAKGLLDFARDSEYVGISFVPGIGQTPEAGRNKVEIVLQRRDPQIDSDLAWRDVSILASGLAGEASRQGLGLPPFTTAGGTRAKGGLLQDIDIGGIDLGPFDPNVHLPDLGQLLDPAFWTGSVSLPAAGAAPIRIAVREYERFYTDEAVTEARAGARRQRRIVEERMVYCVFYVFCSLEQAVASISINQPGFTMAATCMTVRDGKLRSWSRKYSV